MLSVLLLAGCLLAPPTVPQQSVPAAPRLQVFLDCRDCFADYLREETSFVDFVRDRSQADVHVIVTNTGTSSGGREYVLAFIGGGRRAGSDQTLKVVTGTGDPEDVRRPGARSAPTASLQTGSSPSGWASTRRARSSISTRMAR